MKLGIPPLVSEDTINGLIARIERVWGKDHRSDGHHKDIYQHGRTTALGDCADVPFDAADYTAQAGTWTIPLSGFLMYYSRRGSRTNGTMDLWFELTTTTLSGTPTYLQFRLPENVVVVRQGRDPFQVNDNGTEDVDPGWAFVSAGVNYVQLYRDATGTATYAASAAQTSVRGRITLNVRDAQL